MASLEKKFHKEVLEHLEEAQQLCGYDPQKFLQYTNKFGLVQWAKQAAKRGLISPGFEPLHKAGLLQLSIEALIVDKQYAELFSDEEVNYYFDLLCEYGYYQWLDKKR